MEDLEKLINAAKAQGYTRDAFVRDLTMNPKYRNLNPSELKSAWDSTLKKKDQSQPSSPGA